MKVIVRDNYEAMSAFAANEIIDTVLRKKNATICVAAGQTPQLTYEIVSKRAKREYIDFSEVNIVGLDEWVGIPPNDPGSCSYFLRKNVIDPLEIHPERYRLFDALSNDLEQQCDVMDNFINSLGGIDVVVLGIGMNGHLGFNEPGVSFETKCHVISLDPLTGVVGQKYFSKHTDLQKGITVGMAHLLNSKRALLLANGKHKSSIVAATVNQTISDLIPASALRLHNESIFVLDKDAAMEIG